MILLDLNDARRARFWSMLAAPVGLVAIVSVFVIDMPWMAKAILIACGGLADIATFFGWRTADSRLRQLTRELKTAQATCRHVLYVECFTPKSGKSLFEEVAEWSQRNGVFIRVANNQRSKDVPYMFSFGREEDLILFRMKFIPEGVAVTAHSEDD